jgi:hypothetical protein
LESTQCETRQFASKIPLPRSTEESKIEEGFQELRFRLRLVLKAIGAHHLSTERASS